MTMEKQLNFDLRTRITTGKKTERLSIPCSDELLKLLDDQAQKLGTERAKLAYQYVLEGIVKTIGEIFMTELRGDEKLSEILAK